MLQEDWSSSSPVGPSWWQQGGDQQHRVSQQCGLWPGISAHHPAHAANLQHARQNIQHPSTAGLLPGATLLLPQVCSWIRRSSVQVPVLFQRRKLCWHPTSFRLGIIRLLSDGSFGRRHPCTWTIWKWKRFKSQEKLAERWQHHVLRCQAVIIIGIYRQRMHLRFYREGFSKSYFFASWGIKLRF